MKKIYLYSGERKPEILGHIRAEVTFSDHTAFYGIMNRKIFRPSEANKGLEALKRWISTGAFHSILIEDLSAALLSENGDHIAEWISEHAEEPDSPFLILLDDRDSSSFPFSVSQIETADELIKILTT